MTTRRKMIIRARTFEAWLKSNLDKGQRQDIANHGADAGWPGLTYTSDCVDLFNKFEDEIWNLAVDMSEDMGYSNVAAMIAEFRRSDMCSTIDSFKNLMVWFAAETYCDRELNSEV